MQVPSSIAPRTTPPASPSRKQCIARSAAVSTSKDMSSHLLQSVLSAGLAGRLRAHKHIQVDVKTTAASLVQGVFGGMSIKGTSWETPLSLTAKNIEVDVGELLLDYGALMTKSSLALRNLPTGTCKIKLSPADLGNFMSHPLLKPVSDKAVQGKAFVWDCGTVQIGQDAAGAGCVDFEGVWEADGGRYRVRMVPSSPPKGSSPGTGGALKVSARKLAAPAATAAAATDVEGAAAPYAAPQSSEDPLSGLPSSPTAAAATVVNNIVPAGQSGGSSAVAQGLAQMFSSLQLNLQGIELSRPVLEVVLEEGGSPMLEISMKMRIRSLPPLDMQF